MKKIWRDYAFLAVIAGSIIALDQISKAYIRANLPVGEMWMPWDWLAPYARIVHWYNTGAAFGIFQSGSDVFKVLAAIVCVAIIYYFPKVDAQDWTLRLALSMQLAGAAGNLIDRIAVGHVTDFISVGNFPVFNVADSSITVGVGVMLLGAYLQERREKQAQAEVEPNTVKPITNEETFEGESEVPIEQENVS